MFFYIPANRDGTTDVTRTWHFGTPTAFQIECNTRVLKGQMSLGRAIFPNKVKVNYFIKMYYYIVVKKKQKNRVKC